MTKSEVSITQLWEHYKQSRSVWRTAAYFNLAGQSVHERLTKNGYKLYGAKFTKEEDEAIKMIYSLSPGVRNLNLKNLAETLGRPHHSNICRRARELGLTSMVRKLTKEQGVRIGERSKEYIEKNGHPRGALGMKHTAAAKTRQSQASKDMWANPKSKVNTPEHRQALSDRMAKFRAGEIASGNYNPYSNAKSGWAEFNGGKRYFLRSGWELKYARYLETLLKGNAIKSWEYEPDTFWFEKIKRGVRSYTPDFKIVFNDEAIEYHEVKGWMDPRSKTKIKRMSIYYPATKLVIVDQLIMKGLGLL